MDKRDRFVTVGLNPTIRNSVTRTVWKFKRVQSGEDDAEISHDPDPGSDGALGGYWLPNVMGDAPEIVLGEEADYMFTPSLNGCTFVCETSAAPRVAHVASDAPLKLQAIMERFERPRCFGPTHQEEQRGQAIAEYEAEHGTLDPGDEVSILSTVRGFRRLGNWTFGVQTRVTILRDGAPRFKILCPLREV